MPRYFGALPGVIAAELVLVALLVPIMTFPRGWLPALGVALPLLWLADRARWRTFARLPWAGWLLLLTIAAIGSTAAAMYPAEALPKLLTLLIGIAAVVSTGRAFASGIPLHVALSMYLSAGCALAVAVLVGTDWTTKWPGAADLVSYMPRLIRGLPGAEDGFHPNAVAGAIVLFIPCALQAAFSPLWPRAVRIWAVAAGSLGLLSLVLSQSRGAIVGLAIGFALTGLLVLPARATRRLRVAAIVGGVIAATAATLLLIAPSRLEAIAGPNLSAGLSSRLELWDRTGDLIARHPWTGVGFNGFRRQIQIEQPLLLFELSERPPHAHNLFLQTAADLGLAGFAIYVALLAVVVLDLTRVACGRRKGNASAAAALLTGLLAHLGFGLTDAIPLGTKVGFAFWLAIAYAGMIMRERFRGADSA